MTYGAACVAATQKEMRQESLIKGTMKLPVEPRQNMKIYFLKGWHRSKTESKISLEAVILMMNKLMHIHTFCYRAILELDIYTYVYMIHQYGVTWTSWRMDCLFYILSRLTHWGRVTHIYVGKLTIIGSNNSLSPERRQAIIWTNAGILLIGPLGTHVSEISIEIQIFSLKKIRLKMSSAKCCLFRVGLIVLIYNTNWISTLVALCGFRSQGAINEESVSM